MKTIDTRGFSCPEPVIMVKKAVESKERLFKILVDSNVANDNVIRFLRHAGIEFQQKEVDGEFEITTK